MASGIGLLACSYRDLDMGSCAGQLADSDGGASGARLFEVSRVDRIHTREQVDIGEVDLHGDDVAEPHVRFLQYQTDVLQALLDLGFEVVGDLAGREVLAGLAGDVERAV